MSALRFAGSVPADTGANDNVLGVIVTPDASIATGDLVAFVIAERANGRTFTHALQAGQTWQSNTNQSGSTLSVQVYWCIFNGTWTGGTVSWTSSITDGTALTAAYLAFSPTSGFVWTLTPNVAFATAQPGSATTHTITGQTPTASASVVTIAGWGTPSDARTWASLTGGWSYGHQQIRNTPGSGSSVSSAYLIQASAAATGNVSNTLDSAGTAQTLIGTFIEIAVAGQPMAIRGRGIPGMSDRALFGRGF